jgi:hypothetical protein
MVGNTTRVWSYTTYFSNSSKPLQRDNSQQPDLSSPFGHNHVTLSVSGHTSAHYGTMCECDWECCQ